MRTKVRSAGTSAIAAVACAVVSPYVLGDLIHHYPFDKDARDVVGGADGVLMNGAMVADGVLVVDGIDDFVQIGQKIVPTSTQDFTVALRSYQDMDQSGWRETIGQGVAGCCGFYIGHDPADNFRIGDSWTETGVPFPPVGSWHHIAVTVNTSTNRSRLYVNGTPCAEVERVLMMTDKGQDTIFGRQYDPFAEHFDGMLDDIRIYDHALTESEVLELSGFEPCPADLDCSGAVDFGDILAILAAWGNKGGPEDLDGSGTVDFGDILVVLGAWGPCE